MALRLSEVKKVECENGRRLVKWLEEVSRFTGKRILVVENRIDLLRLRLYTSKNRYSIVVNDRGYLGCQALTRMPRPGEDWRRGNDLPDGDFCEKTLREILGAIVFYEALEVAK